MIFLYDLGIRIYHLLIFLASPFHPKARLWVSGRKALLRNLVRNTAHLERPVWFHAASLGEFEQGRPLIEEIKTTYPGMPVILTFYSPSGYEIRKSYQFADYVTYLPLDTKANARQFLDIVNPRLAIFIKYDIWYHFFKVLIDKKIPLFLVSAIFRPDQFYFKRPGNPFKALLKRLDQIFVQDKASYALLHSHDFRNITLAGDTRVDRVLSVVEGAKSKQPLLYAIPDRDLVAGSTWPEDEKCLKEVMLRAGVTAIIAPHDIQDSRIRSIEDMVGGRKTVCRLSALPEWTNAPFPEILIVDSIGQLSVLYCKGALTYVGGGFGSGIHNILEPAAHLKPVIFGPRHRKFQEARDLITLGAGFSISSGGEFSLIFDELQASGRRQDIARTINMYLSERQGATQRILSYLRTKRMLNP